MSRVLVIAALFATGCNRAWVDASTFRGDSGGLPNGFGHPPADSDYDGLVDSEDPFPFDVDVDADWLNDSEELAWGTAPSNPDTDGDGYLDGDEVLEGTSPTDALSRIYQGGWPYFRDKDTVLGELAFGGTLGPGDRFPRHRAVDFHNQQVDGYDFGGVHQKYVYVVVTAVAEDCATCADVASWLAGGSDPQGFEANHAAVRQAVDDGTLLWVTVISRDAGGSPGGLDATQRWDGSYDHPRIPVLADPAGQIEGALPNGLPAGLILQAEGLQIESIGGLGDGFLTAVQARLP